MCGFIGRIARGGDPRDLSKSLPWIRRRGPDSQRMWTSADGQVQLLHARLAIVDKDSRAIQPLADASGCTVACFSGEIYNYAELRQKLGPYPYRTASDTEVILAAYTLHGMDGIRLLKGMFSLVIVDDTKKRIILARDPIGKKPLILARWGGQVFFGTNLVPLVAAYGKAVPLSETAAPDFWKHGFIPPHVSALCAAAPVQPGCLLELDWSGQVLQNGRCEPEPQVLYSGEPLAEVQKRLKVLLKQAVQKRLENNPSPTLLLSGGIDSTVIAAIAQGLCEGWAGRPPLKILTLGAIFPGLNDELFALYVGRRIGINVEVIRPRWCSIPEAVLRAIDLQDEPLGMISFFPLERLVHAAAQRSKILISGDGGDEIFLGYGKPEDWRKGTSLSDSEWMSEWGKRVITVDLVGHVFPKLDRASAEQGVEIRCPLLDWDLVSYAQSLPFNMITHGNCTKALLKDQLAGWPAWFVNRPKMGFFYNLRWLWASSGYAGLRETIDDQAVDFFKRFLPDALFKKPSKWETSVIFRHFEACWQLLVWSRFLRRINTARISPL